MRSNWLNEFMSEYADITLRRLRHFIRYLSRKTKVQLERGGRHVDVVRYPYWERPFPLPVKHGVVNKHIVKKLMDQLIKEELTSQIEIDKKL